jgi:hypothetical protein
MAVFFHVGDALVRPTTARVWPRRLAFRKPSASAGEAPSRAADGRVLAPKIGPDPAYTATMKYSVGCPDTVCHPIDNDMRTRSSKAFGAGRRPCSRRCFSRLFS